MDIFGTADMSTSTIGADVEVTNVHSTVSFTKAQLNAMLVLNLDAGSTITVTDATSAADALAALNTVSQLNFTSANGDYTINGTKYVVGGENQTLAFAAAGTLTGTQLLTITGAGGHTLTVSASDGAGEYRTSGTTATADEIGALLTELKGSDPFGIEPLWYFGYRQV